MKSLPEKFKNQKEFVNHCLGKIEEKHGPNHSHKLVSEIENELNLSPGTLPKEIVRVMGSEDPKYKDYNLEDIILDLKTQKPDKKN